MYTKVGGSVFKTTEKRYKECNEVEDAIKIGSIDFEAFDENEVSSSAVTITEVEVFGKKCKKYEIVGYEGAFFVTNVLNRKQQVELAYSSLSESLRPPNRTNLHCHYNNADIAEKLQSIWASDGPALDGLEIKNNKEEESGNNMISKRPYRFDFDSCNIAHAESSNLAKHKRCHSVGEGPKKQQGKQGKRKKPHHAGNRIPSHLTLSKVRWATLGYQYNWTERSYSKHEFVPFPEQLGGLAQLLAHSCSRYGIFRGVYLYTISMSRDAW